MASKRGCVYNDNTAAKGCILTKHVLLIYSFKGQTVIRPLKE